MATIQQSTIDAEFKDTPKFCKDCQFYFCYSRNSRPDCTAPIPSNLNLVSGQYRRACHHERLDSSSPCGPSGKMFKANLNIPERRSE